MKYILLTFLISFCCLACSAQSFEGKVIYNASYESKIPNLSSEQFSAMAGNTLNYYMKGGNYRIDCNGTYINWQIYTNSDNKLYNKFSTTDTISWNDGAVNPDSILSVQLNKGVVDILGYKCDELVFNCKSGVQKYYFTSKFPIDSKLYSKQLYQNWYDYLKRANAVPLKIMIESAQVNVVMVATAITSTKIDDAIFTLPAGSKTVKATN
jgi:hypothetical protein